MAFDKSSVDVAELTTEEIHRVLKPGGIAYMSFSNRSGQPHRCF